MNNTTYSPVGFLKYYRQVVKGALTQVRLSRSVGDAGITEQWERYLKSTLTTMNIAREAVIRSKQRAAVMQAALRSIR